MGDLARCHLKENEMVAGGQTIGVGVIDLKLTISGHTAPWTRAPGRVPNQILVNHPVPAFIARLMAQ